MMAILLVVVVTTVMTHVTVSSNANLRRTSVLTHLNQAQHYTDALLTYAERVLVLDKYRSSADSLDEDWAQRLPAYSIDGGEVSGHINEYSSRFNLAQLRIADRFAVDVFYRLFSLLALPRRQADAVIEQIRQGQRVSVIGAFASAGMAEADIHRVSPFFSFLPINSEKLNMNVVSPEVFAAYFEMTIESAKNLLAERLSNPIQNQSELMAFASKHNLLGKKAAGTGQNAVSVIELKFSTQSRYFQVVGQVQIGDAVQSVVAYYDRASARRLTRLSRRHSQLMYE
ncbi:type II secretion system minor pseudopilin [Ostreibacterium oceani]|uniref:Type II secretion system protein K n=1 Tax=Ostreibacterium oceani TaxID=2654998 RepID=A0A6N7ET97_9GAMM|nr:type II secretion system protein GspK [Ostreibacterium oceani]MPV85662.1 hypothetical protein [Ostreibacterium oceani]